MSSPTDGSTDLSLDQLVELERRAAERAGAGGSGDTTTPTGDRRDADDGDAIVLPWWQHPVNIVTLIVTAAILAGMVGWMVGDSRSDVEYNDVDVGFLHDMRTHHEQAVLMGFIYRSRDDIDPGLSTIARSIIVGQSLEVGRMIQLLRDFGEPEVSDAEVSMLWMGMLATPGQMPGLATDAELDELGTLDGAEADEMFADLMIEHHIGGIEMAEFTAERGENDEVRDMAAAMASGQRGEIAEMRDQLD